MLLGMLVFAAESETSKTPFYVAGALLAAWAVLSAAIGIKRHESWPERKVVRNGLIGVTALLVAATAASAVLTA